MWLIKLTSIRIQLIRVYFVDIFPCCYLNYVLVLVLEKKSDLSSFSYNPPDETTYQSIFL